MSYTATMETTDAVTVGEAATVLGVDGATIRRRLARGVMQGERVGPRLWLIPKEEIERWRSRGKLRPGRKPREQEGSEADKT